ncbi:MAG: para-aminobenzoate synthetase component 1 [Saprospiraceae bacterium]|jgi:para-aminobenzoate synthetase component 1
MTITTTQRQTATFPLQDVNQFKKQAFQWASTFEVFCFLDNNGHTENAYISHEGLLAVRAESHILHTRPYGAFRDLQEFYDSKKDWLFGFLSYDLKNDTEALTSHNPDGLVMPEMHFFQPTYLFDVQSDSVKISSKGLAPDLVFQTIQNVEIFSSSDLKNNSPLPSLQARISKEKYIETVKKVKRNIQLGDIYEMNFCQEFYAQNAEINPYTLFQKLNKKANTPFAAFYKLKNRYLLCASPERFMKKEGRKLISQPIKGTAPRDKNKRTDLELKDELFHSQKNRSENVMIVDLVRNDLARSCKAGTVHVEELYGIYGFEKVWQMISTVVGKLREDVHFVEAIKRAFAMGSMTGTPKIRAMELIEEYEQSKRGLYSGAVGYITPDGDFDFNVIIRSLIYNEAEKYLSFQVGGAIVDASDPEEEYKECLLKGKNISEVLSGL